MAGNNAKKREEKKENRLNYNCWRISRRSDDKYVVMQSTFAHNAWIANSTSSFLSPNHFRFTFEPCTKPLCRVLHVQSISNVILPLLFYHCPPPPPPSLSLSSFNSVYFDCHHLLLLFIIKSMKYLTFFCIHSLFWLWQSMKLTCWLAGCCLLLIFFFRSICNSI